MTQNFPSFFKNEPLNILGDKKSHKGVDLEQHPVRQEIVDQIKAKTVKWVPQEVEHNHFSKMPKDEIMHTLGSLDSGTPDISASWTHDEEKEAPPSAISSYNDWLAKDILGSFASFLTSSRPIVAQSKEQLIDTSHIPKDLKPKVEREDLRPK